jgi:serine/threonine-protein kinase HipA
MVPGGSRIGALSFTPAGGEPHFDPGAPIAMLVEAERAAVRIDALDRPDEFGLARLAEAGSSVGGARPKALVTDGDTHYLAKFNRLSGDPYNNARVELACLEMAGAAGLDVARGRVVEGVNDRDVLLLERFDIAADGHRHHLVTANSLLKEESTERDSGLPFRYDDVAEMLSRYSDAIEPDLRQLARLALFNRAINNTDDHSRNFSLIHRGDGYRLSPAYDLVPNLAVGEYHTAGFGYGTRPPSPSEVPRLGKVFGLSKPWMRTCAEEVLNALAGWPAFAERAGVDEAESERIGARLNP